MLQWLNVGSSNRIIFNDFRNNKFVSVIFKFENQSERVSERVFEFPIYAIHPNNKEALTLNFSRLDNVREGYGYKGFKDDRENEIAPENDGIYLATLDEGKQLGWPIIQLAELKRNFFISSMNEGKHWVDHLTFNSSGNRFAFFHRWQLKNGGMYNRLYTANKDGSDLCLLLDTGMASHFSWFSEKELVAWGRSPSITSVIGKKSKLRKLIVPIYHSLFHSQKLRQKISRDAFIFFQDRSESRQRIGEGILTEDGHISFSPDKKWLLTDTFDSKNHYRGLVLFNMDSKQKIEVGSFYTLPKDINATNWDSSSLRCDLHPRWNRDGTQICIDSVHEGSRQICIFDVSAIVNKYDKN